MPRVCWRGRPTSVGDGVGRLDARKLVRVARAESPPLISSRPFRRTSRIPYRHVRHVVLQAVGDEGAVLPARTSRPAEMSATDSVAKPLSSWISSGGGTLPHRRCRRSSSPCQSCRWRESRRARYWPAATRPAALHQEQRRLHPLRRQKRVHSTSRARAGSPSRPGYG